MGIKNLNRFLKEEAKEGIKFISLAELSGKKIAVDISIYMYKYASDDTLIENIYLMLSVFRYYNIIAIFIFDGKPPPEKQELLNKRRQDKKEAEEEYNILKKKLYVDKDIDDSDKQEIICNMDMLKKKFVYINKNNIENVKELIRAYGSTYYDAPGEADELCAQLVLKGKVWACLSEDMDMFVYGCPRVIRYLSLLNHTSVLYDLNLILANLGITQKELREICIISGTDYNTNVEFENDKNSPNLYSTLKYFKKYHKQKNNNIGFYDWLIENTDYIIDYELLKEIYNIFDLQNNHISLNLFQKVKITNGHINSSKIREILITDGFIFPNSAY
jgi:flap endonuclease-1